MKNVLNALHEALRDTALIILLSHLTIIGLKSLGIINTDTKPKTEKAGKKAKNNPARPLTSAEKLMQQEAVESPPISVERVPNEWATLRSYKGKNVLVISYSPYANIQDNLKGQSYINALQSQFKGADVQFVGIDEIVLNPTMATQSEMTKATMGTIHHYCTFHKNPIDYLVLDGDGSNLRIGDRTYSHGDTAQMNITGFLNELSDVQAKRIKRNQMPYVKNIVVSAPSTLSYLPPDRVVEIQKASKRSNWNFYAPTGPVVQNSSKGISGKFMVFSSEGLVGKSAVFNKNGETTQWSTYYFTKKSFEKEWGSHKAAFTPQ